MVMEGSQAPAFVVLCRFARGRGGWIAELGPTRVISGMGLVDTNACTPDVELPFIPTAKFLGRPLASPPGANTAEIRIRGVYCAPRSSKCGPSLLDHHDLRPPSTSALPPWPPQSCRSP